MKAMATVKKYKGAIFVGIGTLAAICIVVTCGLLASCSTQADAGSINAREGVLAAMDETGSMAEELVDREDESPTEDETPDESQDMDSNVSDVQLQSAQPSGSDSAQGESGSTSTPSTGAKSQTSTSTSQSTPQKKWVEDTQQVWVEDKAAWTESVPVYGTKEVSICNVCGSDITGNTSAHSKAHMLAGEGSGHHSEVRQVVTGYSTVSHPAEGHYETKVTGGHWE